MRHSSLHMDVFDVCVELYNCDFNNKRDFAVQKVKVKKMVLNLLFLQIKLHLKPTYVNTCRKICPFI